MVTHIKNLRQNLSDALDTLSDGLSEYREVDKIALCSSRDPDTTKRIYRDALIQRFEYTYELFWKYIRLYVEKIGSRAGNNFAKECFSCIC